MLHYNPRLKSLARALRTRSTLSEVLAVAATEGATKARYRFPPPEARGEFIIDFFAAAPMLAVEIDGDTHRFKDKEDLDRQRKLEALGIHFPPV